MAWTEVLGVKNGSSAIFGGFRWQVNSQDIALNKSNITIQMFGGRSSSGAGIWNTDAQDSYIEFDGGNRSTIQTKYDFRNAIVGSTYYVGSDIAVFPFGAVYTFDVTHNPDGTRTLPIKTFFNGNNAPYLLDITTISTITLPTIARASQPRLDAQSKDFGQTFTIYTDKASPAFTHTITYAFGTATGTIATGVVDSTTWAVPTSLGSQIPTSINGSGTITCDTYNGTTLIGTKTIPFTLSVPASWRAVLTTAHSGFSWVNSPAQLAGYVIQNISSLTLTLAAALNSLVSAYGTTITGYQVRFDTYNSGEVSYVNAAVSKAVGVVAVSGVQYAYFKVKDARGYWSNEVQEQIMGTGSTIYPYGSPSNNGFNVARNASIPTTADYQMNFSRSPVNGANTWNYQRQYWNGSTWVNVDGSPVNIAADTITSVLTHSLPYVEATVYQVRVKLTDLFSTIYYEDTLPTSAVPFAMSAKGAGAGKIPTNSLYDFEVGVRGLLSDGPLKGTFQTDSVAKVTNLNSDMLDGYHAGNATGQIPLSNGTLNTDQNADLLDGKHGSYYEEVLYFGYGNIFGSTTSGNTLVGYGHVRCTKIGNKYIFKGEGRIASASGLTANYNTGISITNIKSILGITATLTLMDAKYNFLSVMKLAGTLYSSGDSQYGYGLSLASADSGQTMHAGRFYDTAGTFGGWDATNTLYAVNNCWIFEFVMTE